jgi:surface antigen
MKGAGLGLRDDWELNVLSKAKMPLVVATIMVALGAGSGAALAGISGTDQNNATLPVGPQMAGKAGYAEPHAVDQYWHDHGNYGNYGYGYNPYYHPPVIVAPAPVYVAPPPVYAYPAPVVVPAPVASRVVCRGSNNGAIIGGIAGATAGAVIGANASHHSWQAATGGSILGFLLGSTVGHAVDAGDQYCTTQAIVAAPIGQPVYWANPAYGMQYQVVPTRQYRRWGTTCRDYQASTVINGRWQQVRGTTCLQPDGSWQIVNG